MTKFIGNYLSEIYDAVNKDVERSEPNFHGGTRLMPKKPFWEMVNDIHDSLSAEKESIAFEKRVYDDLTKKFGTGLPCP
jgi:hypothetical protein